MGRLIDANDLLTVTDIRADGTEFTYVSYLNIEEAPTVLTIPDNPTNGDVIKALFSDVHYVLASQGTPRVVTNLGASFDLDWWNASYNRGTEHE